MDAFYATDAIIHAAMTSPLSIFVRSTEIETGAEVADSFGALTPARSCRLVVRLHQRGGLLPEGGE